MIIDGLPLPPLIRFILAVGIASLYASAMTIPTFAAIAVYRKVVSRPRPKISDFLLIMGLFFVTVFAFFGLQAGWFGHLG